MANGSGKQDLVRQQDMVQQFARQLTRKGVQEGHSHPTDSRAQLMVFALSGGAQASYRKSRKASSSACTPLISTQRVLGVNSSSQGLEEVTSVSIQSSSIDQVLLDLPLEEFV
ncbi:hypothetical protein WISP_60378 [Willisornis vidua]|uniref:Uncharacterized protein n=1 Tax=Willisornis vidua TaxID=1566151 RepID=A0ABQ9DGM1_9PASS|nr:hypothetical protein WISP_60378 [Willisornis vidua]